MSPAAPPPQVSLLRDFSDWLSPMVVKELRQGLRTRTFTGLLMMFHLAMVAGMVSLLLEADIQDMTQSFWIIILLVMLGLMPLRGFSALAGEVNGGTLDMLQLTGISTFKMVFGKWAAAFGQTLLLATSLLPYLIARYQFGGVEIVREGLALLVTVLASAVATAAVIAFSSQKSIRLRVLLLLPVAAGLYVAGLAAFFLIIEGGRMMMMFPGRGAGGEAVGWLCVLMTLLAGYAVYVFLALGTSRMAPPSENHSTIKRLLALGVALGLGALGWWLAAAFPNEPWTMLAVLAAVALTLMTGMDVMTEDMPRSPGGVAGLSRLGRVGRGLGSLLYPGWASGVLFYHLLSVITLATVAAVPLFTSAPTGVMGYVLTVLVCILEVAVVPVCVKVNRRDDFANWWVVQLICAAGAVLMGAAIGAGAPAVSFLGVFTPLTTFVAAAAGAAGGTPMAALGTGAVLSLFWGMAAAVVALQELPVYEHLEGVAAKLQAEEAKKRAQRPPAG